MEDFKIWFKRNVAIDLDHGIDKYQTIHKRNQTFYEVLNIYIELIATDFTHWYCSREANSKEIKESFNTYYDQEIDTQLNKIIQNEQTKHNSIY